MQSVSSFKDFLANPTLENQLTKHEQLVAMDLDTQNPATHRLIKNAAKRVILQHQKEIQALKDK